MARVGLEEWLARPTAETDRLARSEAPAIWMRSHQGSLVGTGCGPDGRAIEKGRGMRSTGVAKQEAEFPA